MSVDKARDTSPKKPIAENKIVEAKPENPRTRLKTNRTLHRKSKVWARVRRRYPKPTRTTGTKFLGRRKSDSASSTAWETYAAARSKWLNASQRKRPDIAVGPFLLLRA
jgi:hypothetical protein